MKIGALLKFYESGYNRYGDEKYNKIKEHGFDCVDFNIMNTETEIYQADGERLLEIINHEKELSEKAGVKIHQVHGPWRIPQDATEQDREERMEKMQKSIRIASLLGCRYWVVHPLMPFTLRDVGSGREKDTWEINLSFMRKLLKTAKEYDITICFENMPLQNFSISTPEKILEFVREINDEHFKICFDTGHVAQFCGMSAGEELRRLGSEVKVLHIHDNKGDGDSHMPPGEGIIDWKDFVKSLKEINFDGVFSLETSPLKTLPDLQFEEECRKLATIAKKLIE